MMCPEIRKANRQVWEERRLPSVERLFLDFYAGKTPSEIQAQTLSGTLESIAFNLCNDAFALMAGAREDLAMEADDLLIKVSEEALRTESFDQRYYAVNPATGEAIPAGEPVPSNAILPTKKQLRMEKLEGRRNVLRCLHYGLWFRTGQRPIDLLRESVEIWKETHVPSDLDSLLLCAAEAEDYEYTADMCRRKIAKAVLPPVGKGFRRNSKYVLLVLCECVLGYRDLGRSAQDGVDHWYERSLQWEPPDPFLPWDVRLGWAYLRGKHFTGVTDARSLIMDLRGY